MPSKLVVLWLSLSTVTISFADEATSVVDHDSPSHVLHTQYFIPPTAHFLFAGVDYSRSEGEFHRLFAMETKNPQDRRQVSPDLVGKGWYNFFYL